MRLLCHVRPTVDNFLMMNWQQQQQGEEEEEGASFSVTPGQRNTEATDRDREVERPGEKWDKNENGMNLKMKRGGSGGGEKGACAEPQYGVMETVAKSRFGDLR